MAALSDRFRDRLAEVEHYFRMLAAVEEQLVMRGAAWRHGRKRLPKVLGEDLSLKLLKANSFLLLYNLVEATVRDTVVTIWEGVEREKVAPLQLKSTMRGVWIGSEFRRKDAFSASGSTYRETALSILEAVVAGSIPKVSFKRIGIGGNIDRGVVSDICEQHGVQFTPPKNTRAGTDLDNVKERRNVLAHGEQTFEEIGSRYTVSDLKGMKVRVAAYLRQYVRTVESYIEAGEFRAA